MKTKAFFLLPITLFLVLSISGCTNFEIPGIGPICIPGIGNCGGTTEYENDILIIKTLDAIPQTISTGQQLRLSAWITNNGGETVPQTYFKSEFQGYYAGKVRIKLYDSCEGLFEPIKVICPEFSDRLTTG